MPRTFPELPDWSFDADEASVGVYRAFGRDRAGRNVEASGVDPEALIEKKGEEGVKSKGRVAQMGSFQKKIVPKLAMMW